jgi:hypothetical protein
MFQKIVRTLNPQTPLGLGKIDIPDPAVLHPKYGDPENPKQWTAP